MRSFDAMARLLETLPSDLVFLIAWQSNIVQEFSEIVSRRFCVILDECANNLKILTVSVRFYSQAEDSQNDWDVYMQQEDLNQLQISRL